LQKGFTLKERDFFKEPFRRQEITAILNETPASEMFNFNSPSFKKMGLKAEDLTEDDLIDLMLGEPRMVRRPVVIINGKTYFGASQKVLESELKIR